MPIDDAAGVLKKQLKSFSLGTAHATSSGRTLLTLIHVDDGRLYLLKQQDAAADQ